MDLEEKLARVSEALAALEAQRGTRVREPVVPEDEVAAVERQFGVALPEEYRAFVTRVARGLIDPEIWPFDECRYGGHEARSWAESELRLAEPFDHPIEWPDDEAEAEALEDALLVEPERGRIPIAYWGCQYYDYLVVTGPERGSIWCAEVPHAFDPLLFESGPATFLEYAMFRVMNALHGGDSFAFLHGRR